MIFKKSSTFNHWVKNPYKLFQTRKRKLEDKYILNLAGDETISNMTSSKKVSLINKDLQKDGKNISVHKSTVCRILNKELGRIKKYFI